MSANRNGRVEIERTVLVANEPATLYLNSGRRDDCVDLVMPAGWRFDPSTHPNLSSLTRESADWSIQASLIPGPPLLVAITRLPLRPDDSVCAPAVDRYTGLLCELAAALPEVDFGELAPQRTSRLVSPDDGKPDLSATGTSSTNKGDNRELAVAINESGAASLSREESIALSGGAPASGASVSAAAGGTKRVGDLLERAQSHALKRQLHKACRPLDDALRESPGHLGAAFLRDRIGRADEKGEASNTGAPVGSSQP